MSLITKSELLKKALFLVFLVFVQTSIGQVLFPLQIEIDSSSYPPTLILKDSLDYVDQDRPYSEIIYILDTNDRRIDMISVPAFGYVVQDKMKDSIYSQQIHISELQDSVYSIIIKYDYGYTGERIYCLQGTFHKVKDSPKRYTFQPQDLNLILRDDEEIFFFLKSNNETIVSNRKFNGKWRMISTKIEQK